VLGSAPLVEQKGFLKSFVKSIEVSSSEVTISYTVPMPPLCADRETVGVLDFDLSGRPCRARTCDTLIKSKVHVGPSSAVKYLLSLFCSAVSGVSCLPVSSGVVPC